MQSKLYCTVLSLWYIFLKLIILNQSVYAKEVMTVTVFWYLIWMSIDLILNDFNFSIFSSLKIYQTLKTMFDHLSYASYFQLFSVFVSNKRFMMSFFNFFLDQESNSSYILHQSCFVSPQTEEMGTSHYWLSSSHRAWPKPCQGSFFPWTGTPRTRELWWGPCKLEKR